MKAPASVGGRDRLRLFCALPLPDDARDRLVRWQAEVFGAGVAARVVGRENLHFTLAFLGHRPASDVGPVAAALRDAAAESGRPSLTPVRYRETRSVGMVVFDDAEGRAGALAEDVQRRLEALRVYVRERRPWLPHVTALRFRLPPRLRLDPPELGEVSPSDVALYHSVLRSGGAQYEVLESFALGG